MAINFGSLLQVSKTVAKAGLGVGSVIHPRLRSDGGKGLVLVFGRITRNGRYGSKRDPIVISVKIEDLGGETTTETFRVTDADGVHLGQVDRGQVEEMLAQIKSMTITEIK